MMEQVLQSTTEQGRLEHMIGLKSIAVEGLAAEEHRIVAELEQLHMSVAAGHSFEGRVERNFELLGPEERIVGALGRRRELLVRMRALVHKRELLVRCRRTEQLVLRHSLERERRNFVVVVVGHKRERCRMTEQLVLRHSSEQPGRPHKLEQTNNLVGLVVRRRKQKRLRNLQC
jgi:hypothetical protein